MCIYVFNLLILKNSSVCRDFGNRFCQLTVIELSASTMWLHSWSTEKAKVPAWKSAISVKYTSSVFIGCFAKSLTRKSAFVVLDAFRKYPMNATPRSELSFLPLFIARLELWLLELCKG